MKKRIFSALMALALCFSLLPALPAAAAADALHPTFFGEKPIQTDTGFSDYAVTYVFLREHGPYSIDLAAEGGTAPYSWELISWGKPSGSAVEDGRFTFDPAAEQTHSEGQVTLFLRDSSTPQQEAQMTLFWYVKDANDLPKITTESPLPTLQAGSDLFVSIPLLASNTRNGTVWEQVSGTLPKGLAVSSDLNGDGVISGMVTDAAPGTYSFRVRVTTMLGSDEKDFSLQVTTAHQPPEITNASGALPYAVVGQSYRFAPAASGTAPFTWAISSGTLPEGLSLDPATGVISGTPVGPHGQSAFTLSVSNRDLDGGTYSDSAYPYIQVFAPPAFETTALPAGRVGVFYDQYLVVQRTAAAEVTGLPKGLDYQLYNSGALEFSGTPAVSGDFTLHVKLTGQGPDGKVIGTKEQAVLLHIAGENVPAITTKNLPRGNPGSLYHAQIYFSPEAEGVTLSLSSGTLPQGLSLDPATGVISGTIDAAAAAKDYPITVRLQAQGDYVTQALVLTVTKDAVAPRILTKGVTCTALAGSAFSYQLKATGTAPLSWTSGDLPAWLTLDTATGLLHGTIPEEADHLFYLNLSVENAAGSDDTYFQLYVERAPAFTTHPKLPDGAVGSSYSTSILTVNCTEMNITGPLPAGLDSNHYNGEIIISGYPETLGDFTITVEAKNMVDGVQYGKTAVRTFTLHIGGQLPTPSVTPESDTFLFDLSKPLTAACAAPSAVLPEIFYTTEGDPRDSTNPHRKKAVDGKIYLTAEDFYADSCTLYVAAVSGLSKAEELGYQASELLVLRYKRTFSFASIQSVTQEGVTVSLMQDAKPGTLVAAGYDDAGKMVAYGAVGVTDALLGKTVELQGTGFHAAETLHLFLVDPAQKPLFAPVRP